MTDQNPNPTSEPDSPVLIPTIEHLFQVDPLHLTETDLTSIVLHYRSTRLAFLAQESKPKTVERSRGPKLNPEASRNEINNVLRSMKLRMKTDGPK